MNRFKAELTTKKSPEGKEILDVYRKGAGRRKPEYIGEVVWSGLDCVQRHLHALGFQTINEVDFIVPLE